MNLSLTLSSLRGSSVTPCPAQGTSPSAIPDLPPATLILTRATLPAAALQPRGLWCPHGALWVPRCDAHSGAQTHRGWGSLRHKGAQSHGDKRAQTHGWRWGAWTHIVTQVRGGVKGGQSLLRGAEVHLGGLRPMGRVVQEGLRTLEGPGEPQGEASEVEEAWTH